MKFLNWAICACRNLEARLVRMQSAQTIIPDHGFMALTPKKLHSDPSNEYFRALRFALAQKSVKNIAVTGAYGAGKSTVINSFLDEYEKGHFINVSLAGFDMPGNGDPAKSQEVELSILQQILYKKNRDALPDSRIDRILNRNKAHIRRVFWSSLKIFLPIGGVIFLMFHEKAQQSAGVPEKLYGIINEVPYGKIFLLLLLTLVALYNIAECASKIGVFDKKIKLNKVGLLSGELEVDSREASSLLNNCLDEIVYFFSKLKEYRIVVFEDLDRLKNPEIFVKLREINKIVNNNLSEEKPLRFIYAVRDDIFSGAASRTKFFDFIVPVVPVMDSRNSFSLLNTNMSAMLPGGEECMRGTATYIGDMRSLLNIVNEYRIFSAKVDNNNRKVSLYAMVFYKNIFAHDYSLIDRKISVLYRFVYQYRIQKLHEHYFSGLDDRIDYLNRKLIEIRSEKLTTAEDVRRSLIYSFLPEKLMGMVYFFNRPSSGYNQYALQQADTDELISDESVFENFFSSANISVGYISQNRYITQELTDAEIKKISDSYQKRKVLVGEERENNFIKFQGELKQAREEKRRRNAISLAELIKSLQKEKFDAIASQYLEDIDTHDFLSADHKKAVRDEMRYGGVDALYLLLSRGYLDQDFMRSRSVFHDGGLSVNDNEFIKSVALGISATRSNEDTAIDDVGGVILEIAAQHLLHHDASLHYQIVAHMLKTDDIRLDEMLATLFTKSGEHVLDLMVMLESRFTEPDYFPLLLTRALDNNGYLDVLVVHLSEAAASGNYSRIAAAIISRIDPERAEKRSTYRHYVESLGTGIADFLEPDEVQTFQAHIASLDVRYGSLSVPLSEAEQDYVRFIGETSLYRLTRENVGITFAAQLPEALVTAEECKDLPWTTAKANALPALEYFSENADEFVEAVFLHSQEQSIAVTDVLSLEALSKDMKLRIVKEMSFCLDSLTVLPAGIDLTDLTQQLSFHDLFYHHDRIQAAWPELITYIGENCNMQVLTSFMTRHADTLSLSGPGVSDGDAYDLLYIKVICNAELSDEDYKKILTHVDINTSFFDERLSSNLLILLLGMNKISLSQENFSNVIKSVSDSDVKLFPTLVSWFCHYQSVFMALPDFYLHRESSDIIFTRLLDGLMNSTLFSDKNKMDLYHYYEEHYLDGPESEINLPQDIKIIAFSASNSQEMKMRLVTSLIDHDFRDKVKLADMAEELSENELRKIFVQKTEATLALNDRDICIPLLDTLRKSALIKDYDLREDGKVFVTIRRPVSESKD
ncbi:P-loop NTPase fold protein [Pantoea agglomerans]|uniref:YobI family P-loop NTPase n=1 Tax=Enterobacter agglomerans TaxID=549 RepID=UPI003207B7B5